MSRVLMVIAPEMFRDEEYEHPKTVLEQRGATVTTASVAPGTCRGKLGMRATATIAVADADARDYDAVVFVGGDGASVFFDDPHAHQLARAASENGRVLAAICIAPGILARAGLLAGRRATAFESEKADLITHGALFTGAPVEVDGRVITANGPAAARLFGEAIADALGLH
ncbi:MAG: DJ-1/PfpI family protein [Actinomycetia bacterium]|nr:DJ-1/PfpI family protein [Actinomycetes bacterium]